MNVQDGILFGVLFAVLVYSVRDGFLFWLLIRRMVGGGVVSIPGTGTGPPIALPPPAGPGTDPTTPASPKPRFTKIDATSFGGRGDTQSSAYGGMVNPDKLGASLPARVAGQTLSVTYKGKTVSRIPVVDLGPWNTSDKYWDPVSRPASEAQHASGTKAQNGRIPTNTAGIDLTPDTWTALGWAGDPNQAQDLVDWDFDSYLKNPTGAPPATPALVTGDPPWLVLGRSFNGLVWHKGMAMPPQIVAWMDNIAAKFPEMQAECQMLKTMGSHDWWAWCGGFVQSMLSYSNIRGPFGPADTDKWPWAKSWAKWGTKVWMPEDGRISNAKPMPGDVLVWSFGHVSFYDHYDATNDDFSSTGGDQGTPLRVCTEGISMDNCIAIRRPT